MATHETVIDLLPAYALDCLDEAELITAAEHLAHCERCRAELRAYQATRDQLALALPLAAPSARVERQLLARIRRQPEPQPQPSGWQLWLTRLRQSAPVWGLAALLLLVGLAASNLLLWQQVNQLTRPAQPAVMSTLTLAHTPAAPEASGMVVVSSDGEYGALVVEHLPLLPASQQYQLWLIQDGQRTSGALFSVDKDGYRAVQIKAPRPLSEYTGFGVSIEPAGGSPAPTGDKVLGFP